MVSTVFSKKQFTILSLKEESELSNFAQLAKNRNHLILYPLITKQNVEDVSDLIDEKMQKAIINEIKADHPQTKDATPIFVKNWTGFTVKNVLSIEHLYDNMFRIYTKHGSFMTDSFELHI